ncbi:MAG: hypothetical protein WDM89_06135 [Rhizomicrobium sp.]
MDPKLLKTLLDKKAAVKAATETARLAGVAALKAETISKQWEGQQAIATVVVPYFDEILRAIGPAGFQFSLVPSSNPIEGGLPLGVRFAVGSSVEHEISVASSKVWIKRIGSKSDGVATVFVYPGAEEPYIGEPQDLTRDKIGKLLELVIEKA